MSALAVVLLMLIAVTGVVAAVVASSSRPPRLLARTWVRIGELAKRIEPRHTGRPIIGAGTHPNSRKAAANGASPAHRLKQTIRDAGLSERRDAERLEQLFTVLAPLNGEQRGQVLTFARSLSSRPVWRPAWRIHRPEDAPVHGSWELYGELEQLEAMVEAVFTGLKRDGRRKRVIEFARSVHAAEPPLPPGYSR